MIGFAGEGWDELIGTCLGAVALLRLDPAVPAGAVFLPFCYAEAPANAFSRSSS